MGIYSAKLTQAPYITAGDRIGPSDAWIVYDEDNSPGLGDPTRDNANYPDPGDNHGIAGANVVFCDGHAEWVQQAKYLAKVLPAARTSITRRSFPEGPGNRSYFWSNAHAHQSTGDWPCRSPVARGRSR